MQFVSWTLLSHFIDLGGRFSTPDSPSIHKLPKFFYIISTSIIYVDLWGRATWSFKNLLKFTEFKLHAFLPSYSKTKQSYVSLQKFESIL